MKTLLRLIVGLVFIIVLGGAAYYYLYGAPEAPKVVKVHHIKFKNLSPPPNLKITLEADALVNNPNPFSVNITKIDADVFVDGTKTNEINERVAATIPANSEFDFPLRFDIPIDDKNILKDLGSLVTGAWKKRSIVLKCEGKIYLKASSMDMGIPFVYEEEHRLGDYF